MTSGIFGGLVFPWSENQIAFQIEIPSILERYVRGDFLILSLIVGYVLFFLFFYGKEEPAKTYWSSIEWGERLFLGLLLGMFLLFSFSIGTTLYYYVAQNVLFEQAPDPSLIWFICSWIVGLFGIILRLLVGGPIHGASGQQIMAKVLDIATKPWIWLIPLVFLIVTGLFSSLYSYNSGLLSTTWYRLSGLLFLAVVSCLWIPAVVLLLVSTPVIPRLVIRKLDFRKLVRRIFTLRTLKHAFSSLARNLYRNRNLAKGAVLVVMLSLFIVLSDVQFGVFSPRVSRVDTTVGPSYILEGNLTNYVVHIHVTKAYYVDSPMFWFVRNLTISNPSNFSSSMVSGVSGMRASLNGANAKLSTIANSSGAIESFVLYLSPSHASYHVVLTMDYEDMLAAPIMHVSYEVKSYLGNATYEQKINIEIGNLLDKPILISNLYIGEYPNILNVTCLANDKPSMCYNNSPQQLWLLPQTLSKDQSLAIQLSVVFRYGG